MPFAERFDNVYQSGIAPAAVDVNLTLVKLAELPVLSVVREMQAGICRSDYIIAVATDRNPHVFLEIGLAYAARKPGIVIADKKSGLEIFQDAYPCLLYGQDMKGLRRQLGEELARIMEG